MRAPALRSVLVAWLVLLLSETLCQISLKIAGGAIGTFEVDRAFLVAAVSTPWLWVAIGCYFVNFMAWMTILDRSALSAAFPTSAIVFVSIMIASAVVFREPVHWEKALGSAIIVAGILMLGGERVDTPIAQGHLEAQLENGPRANRRTP